MAAEDPKRRIMHIRDASFAAQRKFYLQQRRERLIVLLVIVTVASLAWRVFR